MNTDAVQKAREALAKAEMDALADAGWLSLETAPRDGTKVHLWMEIYASPMSFGMGDEFAVPDAWFEGGKWLHYHRGAPAELRDNYVSRWRPATDSLDGIEIWRE